MRGARPLHPRPRKNYFGVGETAAMLLRGPRYRYNQQPLTEVAMPTLTLKPLSATNLAIPGADPWQAKAEDPARSVMTDFRVRSSVTVPQALNIDVALEHMKHTGVRCAFAVDEAQQLVVGLITAYDIMGEKPMRYMQNMGSNRAQVQAKDLMLRLADWRVVDIGQIERSTVGAVARLFEDSSLTHIAVMETDERGAQRLRGLLSAAHVRRVLAR